MRLAKLQTLYFAPEELKAAIKLYLAHIEEHELVASLEENEVEMDWAQDTGEFLVMIDNEIGD